MKSYKVLIISAILGILSMLLPVVTYPVKGVSLYGWMGDGFIIITVFILIVVIGIIANFYNKLRYLNFFSLLLAAFNLYVVYSKYKTYINSKENFHVEDIRIAPQIAGFHLDYGFYVYALMSLVVLISSIWVTVEFVRIKRRRVITMLFVLSLGLLSCNTGHEQETNQELLDEAKQNHQTLIKHTFERNYEDFIAMMHPTTVESFGGKVLMKKFLEESEMTMDSAGYELKTITLDSVTLLRNERKPMVYIWHTSEYTVSDSIIRTKDKLLGIRNSQGEWQFVNATSKTEEQLQIYKNRNSI